MLGLFDDLKPLLVSKPKIHVPRPDNLVFKLHYRVTFLILLVACILVSSYSYIDSSDSAIQCLVDEKSPVPDHVINKYCWISSTFTLPKFYNGTENEDFLHYGVGPYKESDEKKYHAYYQWVPLMLFFQAMMFYAPHWIWKQMEGGRLKHAILGLNKHMLGSDEVREQVDALAKYMEERLEFRTEHRGWAAKFYACEALNLVNVIAQIFITDSFLGGAFSSYGVEVVRFASLNPEDRVDPMSRVFPRMTKCLFHMFGSSGTIQRIDALCVLGMNVMSEKIYIFLWFWFIILAIITGFNMIVRTLQFLWPGLRYKFVRLEAYHYVDRGLDREDIALMLRELPYSDWLILYYLAQAMDKKNFVQLLSRLSDVLREREVKMQLQHDDGGSSSSAADTEVMESLIGDDEKMAANFGNLNGFGKKMSAV